ncbi:Pleckstrin homology domain-containing family A member 7 [Tupaia chinensis]|uniref:Pleckstrin homology domain-containing family A member 7 n=1 Tax=Tupaia chinensis TaxID=246437 RepID=L9JBP8_TUPCH|nr:Pleckstrin homology domain-containing family A member 7 [Tupaia chinensis]
MPLSDEEKSTSWVHPGTESPIQSGHCCSPGLPAGWETDSTREGAVYFIKRQHQVYGGSGGAMAVEADTILVFLCAHSVPKISS